MPDSKWHAYILERTTWKTMLSDGSGVGTAVEPTSRKKLQPVSFGTGYRCNVHRLLPMHFIGSKLVLARSTIDAFCTRALVEKVVDNIYRPTVNNSKCILVHLPKELTKCTHCAQGAYTGTNMEMQCNDVVQREKNELYAITSEKAEQPVQQEDQSGPQAA